MSTFGVDVSSYNGLIDWRKVKSAGYEFAILKIIRKDLNKDNAFETNWTNAQNAGVTIQGVYNYSYATGIEKARKDAKAVIKALDGRKTMVWLDVEDRCQMGLGYGLINIINTYKREIEKAGLSFGIYTGLSFYTSYLKPHKDKLNCPMWIARYGNNNGTMQTKYQPQVDNMIGWQYSSNGKVNGIKGNVDLNVFYDMPDQKAVISNPYPIPKRILRAKKILGIWSCRGEDVKFVQYALCEKGFISEKEIDGIYGYGTADAVKRFQKSVGITADGIVGVQTRRYL